LNISHQRIDFTHILQEDKNSNTLISFEKEAGQNYE